MKHENSLCEQIFPIVQVVIVHLYILTETITHVFWLTLNRKLIIFKRTLISHNDEYFFSDVLNHSILKKEQKNTCIAKLFRSMHTRSQELDNSVYVV